MTGLDVLHRQDFALLRNKRIGLVTHPAALSSERWDAAELFAKHTNLVALFGPEHGFTGEAQDLIPVTGNDVYSLYGETFESLKPTRAMLKNLDVLVIDMQDVGSRYYTFQATMKYCMEAAADIGLAVVVLDRGNPIGRALEGPTIQPGFASFVGPHPIATRHGMTMGELATLYRAECVPQLELHVIECVDDRERDWIVPPSPNMPSRTTARVYPGMCLVEGTNLSEGRGTTRPFEYVGFPGVNPQQIAERLRNDDLPGVDFLPVAFRPTFQKHAGQSCGGVFVSPTSDSFRPVRTGLAVLIAFRDILGERFQWRTERYEFVDTIPAIDLLFGSDRERTMIDAGAHWQEIAKLWEPEEAAFRERRRPVLLYPE